MNEEENNEQQEVQDSKLKQAVGRAGKHVVNEATRQAKKVMAEALKKAIAKVVAVLGAKVLIILAILAAVVIGIIAIDDFLDGEAARETDEVTNNAMDEYCTIDEYGVHFDKEKFIETLPKRLKEEIGIDFNDLGLGAIDSTGYFFLNPYSQAAEYLYKYMAAALSSELPYIEGSDEETKGIIKIKRKQNEGETKDLTYIAYQELQDMINSDDISKKRESLDYFSLDSSWNLCVTKWRSTSENGQETSFEVNEVKIPYRKMVSQYTVPFTFLINLQMISLNANYVEAVSKLMTESSYIDFTIFDSVTTDETTYTYEATINTKTKHVEFDPVTMTSYETGDYDKSTSQDGPHVTVTKVETDTIKASVTKAKTWIIDQTITYNLQESREYPYGAEPGKVEESSEPEPEGEGSWRDPIKETWYEEIIKREWVKGAVETKFMPDEFLGLWSNKTGRYVKGASYLPATEASRRETGRV